MKKETLSLSLKRICLSLLTATCVAHVVSAQPTDAKTAPETTAPSVPPALDKANKDLIAQEELLLKQVGKETTSDPVVKNDGAEKTDGEKPSKKAASTRKERPTKPAADDTKSQTDTPTETKKESIAPAKPSMCDGVQLANAQARVSKLTTELEEARNRLMVSETEVERLAHLVDERNRLNPRYANSASSAGAPRASVRVRDAGEIQAKAESDMPIATVISEKAQLRTGPGKDNSPLMTVSQGTRLAIETRQGDWYRVISPTGARAWVASDVIDFGDSSMKPDSAARGKGFSNDPEDAAFEALSRGTTKH